MLFCVSSVARTQFCPIQNGESCLAEFETDNGINVTWTQTISGSLNFSSPLCLDSNKNPIVRTCCNGVWGKTTSKPCSFYALKFSFKCPPGYQEVPIGGGRYICVSLSQPKMWAADCVKSGTQMSFLDLQDDDRAKVFSFLTKRNIKQVWLPAKRQSRYEPIVWELPGHLWHRPVEFENYNIQVRKDIFKGNCVKLIVDTNFLVEADECEKALPVLCVYKYSGLLRTTCAEGREGFETRYATQGKCFFVETFTKALTDAPKTALPGAKDLFSASTIERINIFSEISRELNLQEDARCLVRANGINGSFTVLDHNGKLLVSSYFNCIAWEYRRNVSQPEISLRFDEAQGRLGLTVYSPESIWRSDINSTGINCFTNSDDELVKVLKVKRLVWSGSFKMGIGLMARNVSKAIYEVKMAGDGPGYYWCEAHALPDMSLIKSVQVVASRKQKGSTYSTLMDVLLPNGALDDRKGLKQLAKSFREFLRLSSMQQDHDAQVMAHRVSSVRVMKIESFDPATGRAEIVFHLTVNMNESVVTALDRSFLGAPSLEVFDDKLGVPNYVIEYYKAKEILYRVLRNVSSNHFRFLSLNSTEYCLPVNLSGTQKYNWLSARVGQKSLSKELCLQESGLPLAVKCEGDFIYGGTWEQIDIDQVECISDIPEITKTLANMDEKSLTPQVAKETIGAMSEMTSNNTQIIPADIYFLGKTVQIISDFENRNSSPNDLGSIDRTYYDNLALILNNIMAVDESIVRQSQRSLNSTNILLDSFDQMLSKLSANASLNQVDGTLLLLTPRLLVFIVDPDVQNISGISLHRNSENDTDSSDLFEYDIRPLRSNQSLVELLNDPTVELATFLPAELIQRIDETDAVAGVNGTQAGLQIVFTIYYNDRLFAGELASSLTKVVSVSLPGHGTDLPVLLPTIFRAQTKSSEEISKCGYWDFTTLDLGSWATEGCEYLGASTVDPSIIACGCTHLTHFAYLIMGTHYHQGSDEHKITPLIHSTHTAALDIITFVGCMLSLFGVIGIVITALVFKSWREKPGTKVLLHLSAAIALEMVLIAFVNTESMAESLLSEEKTYNCIILGATLHYSILVAFSWMLITALLQFMRYVKVLGDTRPTRFLLKSSVAGWGAPLIPVILIILINPDSYIPPKEMVAPAICYPKGNALYFGLLLPIALIVIANLVIFVIVMYNIFKIPEVNIRANERDLLVSQLRLSINLFFLLGLSWLFGLATVTKGGIVFSYLFCLTATLQGFVLFLYFIIMDPVTRKFWQLLLSNLGLTCTQKPKDVE